MKTIKQSIQIDTFFEVEEKNSAGRVISVNREVRVNNELVYQCKMSPKIYQTSEDPIRKLEAYILGLKKENGTNNTISNTTDKSVRSWIKRKLYEEVPLGRIYLSDYGWESCVGTCHQNEITLTSKDQEFIRNMIATSLQEKEQNNAREMSKLIMNEIVRIINDSSL